MRTLLFLIFFFYPVFVQAQNVLDLPKSNDDKSIAQVYIELEHSNFDKASLLIASTILIEEGLPIGPLKKSHIPWRLAWGDLHYLKADFNKALLIYGQLDNEMKSLGLEGERELVLLRQLLVHENLDDGARVWDIWKKLTKIQPVPNFMANKDLSYKIAAMTASRLSSFLSASRYQELLQLSPDTNLTLLLWESHLNEIKSNDNCNRLPELGSLLGEKGFTQIQRELYAKNYEMCIESNKETFETNALGQNRKIDIYQLEKFENTLKTPNTKEKTVSAEDILEAMAVALQLSLPQKSLGLAEYLPKNLNEFLLRRSLHLKAVAYHLLSRSEKKMKKGYEEVIETLNQQTPYTSHESQMCVVFIDDLILNGTEENYKVAQFWVKECFEKTKNLGFLKTQSQNTFFDRSLQIAALTHVDSLANNCLQLIWQNTDLTTPYYQKANTVSLDRLLAEQTRLRDKGNLEQSAILGARWAIHHHYGHPDAPSIAHKSWQSLAEMGAWYHLWELTSWIMNQKNIKLRTPETEYWLAVALENMGDLRKSAQLFWSAAAKLPKVLSAQSANKALNIASALHMDNLEIEILGKFPSLKSSDDFILNALSLPMGSDLWNVWFAYSKKMLTTQNVILRKNVITLKSTENLNFKIRSVTEICKATKGNLKYCHQSLELFFNSLNYELVKFPKKTISFIQSLRSRTNSLKKTFSNHHWIHWQLGLCYLEWGILKEKNTLITDSQKLEWNAKIYDSLLGLTPFEWNYHIASILVKFPKEFWAQYHIPIDWKSDFSKQWSLELPRHLARDLLIQHILTAWSLTTKDSLPLGEIEKLYPIQLFSNNSIKFGANEIYSLFIKAISSAFENKITGFFEYLYLIEAKIKTVEQKLFIKSLKQAAEIFWGIGESKVQYPKTIHQLQQPCLSPLFQAAMSFHTNQINAAELWLKAARQMCPFDNFVETSWQNLYWSAGRSLNAKRQGQMAFVGGAFDSSILEMDQNEIGCSKPWQIKYLGKNKNHSFHAKVHFHLYNLCRFKMGTLQHDSEIFTPNRMALGSVMTHLLGDFLKAKSQKTYFRPGKPHLGDKSTLGLLVQSYENSL